MPASPQTNHTIRRADDFPVPPLKESHIDERSLHACFDYNPEIQDGTLTQVIVQVVELVKDELYEVARATKTLKRGAYLYADPVLTAKKKHGLVFLPCKGLIEFIISRTHVECYYAVRMTHLANVAGVTELVLIDSYDRLTTNTVREPVDAVVGAFPETENKRLNEALAILDAAGNDLDITERRNKRRKGLMCFAVLRRVEEVRKHIDGIEVTMDHWLSIALGRFDEIIEVYRSCHRVVKSRLSAEPKEARFQAYADELRGLIADFRHIHAHPFRRSADHIIRDLELAAQAYENGEDTKADPFLSRVRNICYYMTEILPHLLALRLDLTRIVDLKEEVEATDRVEIMNTARQTLILLGENPIDSNLDGVKIGRVTGVGLEAVIGAVIDNNYNRGRREIEKILQAA